METNPTPQEQVIQKFIGDNLLNHTDKEPTVIIRTGLAPKQLDPIKPNKVHISGTISAPSEFYKKRKELHDKNKCHVIFNKTNGTIELVVDEQFENDNYKIKGSIIKNPDLEPFGINQNKTFTIKELMQLVKFNGVHFVDKDDNAKIVLSLQNFKAVVEKTIEDSNDQRGNETKQKIQKLETGLKDNFVLKMPLHKGGEVKTFQVDILCQITDGGVTVWLESKELKEIQTLSLNGLIDAELENFTEIVCIEQ